MTAIGLGRVNAWLGTRMPSRLVEFANGLEGAGALRVAPSEAELR